MNGRGALLAALLVMAAAVETSAQTARSAAVPDTVTVGDVFHIGIRVQLEDGQRVDWPDTLPVADDVENAGATETVLDTVDGTRRVTARYPLSAWRPGDLALPTVALRVLGPGPADARTLSVPMPAVHVQSVLPADTAGLAPREARGVLGPDRLWWAWIAFLLGAAGLGGGLAWWWVRNRGGGLPVPAPGESRREFALALLERARADGIDGERRLKAFHATIAYATRVYLAACDRSLSPDRTTFELEPRVRAVFGERTAADAIAVLRAADLVKFADRRPDAEQAFATWRRAHDWIRADPAGIDRPPPEQHETRDADPPREATA